MHQVLIEFECHITLYVYIGNLPNDVDKYLKLKLGQYDIIWEILMKKYLK